MILNCPACSAKYRLADTAIPAQGRKVRCAACGHSWHQMPEVASASPASDPAAEPIAPARPLSAGDETVLERRGRRERRKFSLRALFPVKAKGDRRKAKRRREPPAAHQLARQKSHDRIRTINRAAASAAWGLALLTAGGGIWAGLHYRADVVKAWPKSASLFSSIGMPANLYGVDIARVQVRSGVDARGPRVIVAGVLRSVSRKTEAVPYLKVALVGPDGAEKLSWLVDPGVEKLEPGKAHAFETVRRNPPRGEMRVVVAFAEPPLSAPRPAPTAPEPPTGKSGLMGARGTSHEASPPLTSR
jgi:predicted Zn finger-like uncharacterized protein